MAKRMTTIFFIVLGCVALLMSLMFLVLFLAPGFSLLGIKYLRAGTHVLSTGAVNIYETVGEGFNGSIILETNEIPVTVYFTQAQNDNVLNNGFSFTYYDNFQGFTTSEFDDPSYTITKDLVGNVTIKTKEYEKLIYESGSSERYINLYIPLVYVDKANMGEQVNLTINAGKAPITFIKTQEDDLRIPAFNKINIKTNGEVAFNTSVYATTYEYSTNNSIEISEDKTKGIDAHNFKLTSNRGAVTVKRDVAGNIEATTNSRDIKVLSCKNLIAKTTYGSVKCYSGEKAITTTGLVNIETKSGDVSLGKIQGTGENIIKTGTGNVSIDSIGNGTLETSAGAVRIKTLNNFKITTNVGKVVVEEAKTKVDVNTKRGNIVIGGNGMSVGEVSAYSRLGKINVVGASGKVNLQTVQNNINFENGSSTDITISSGKAVVATNLQGKVDIFATTKADIVFDKITDTTKITLGDTCTSAKVEALKNTVSNTKYLISGKSAVLWVSNGEGTGTFSKQRVESKMDNVQTLVGEYPYFSITGKNADISVYFNTDQI